MPIHVEAEQATREENNASLIAVLGTNTRGEGESRWALDVINDAEHGRWIAVLGADAVAELTYRYVGGRVVLISTWVDHAYRNQKVATELVSRVLDEVRQGGKKITIICPVVGEFIARNPEYLDLIDPVHPGSGAYPHGDPAPAQEDPVAAFERDMM